MDIRKIIRNRLGQLSSVDTRLNLLQEAVARIEARQLASSEYRGLQAQEFRAFSQWGEDGIIQYLVSVLGLTRATFVEFGVETYIESNTRFLLVNNNWSGLVIDGSEANIAYIKSDPIYWRYNIKAECAFISAENINSLIAGNGIQGDIGLLSVDIDGNDYWVWRAIDCIRPAIVVTEYNARFGPIRSVTTPYDPSFVRGSAHYSNIYYGASLSALTALGVEKGYSLVGCNSAGNNAFFVRNDILPDFIPALKPEVAYVRNQFRECRQSNGELSFTDPVDEEKVLEGLELVDVAVAPRL